MRSKLAAQGIDRLLERADLLAIGRPLQLLQPLRLLLALGVAGVAGVAGGKLVRDVRLVK